ncbi:MAG: glycosyltransferase family 2 protein [Cyanobacteria bacterium P01_G01_bin.38]
MLSRIRALLELGKTEGYWSLLQRLKLKLKSPRYFQWIHRIEQIEQGSQIAPVESSWPLISILMPVYNVEARWLIKAVESVLAQRYPRWQLCLADDVSTVDHIRPLLARYAAQDDRIQVVYLAQNSGISAATNAALDIAKGEFIALLDHDDELAPNALYEIAKCWQQFPDIDFIYTDEDQITPAGKRQLPFFKPDWSPDYLHACMYVCHLSVYRVSLVRQLGGFRGEYDGAQDWDLALRVAAQTDRIHHIPKVLYHWRTLPTSMASGELAKPWAYEAAQRSLQDMLNRSPYPGWVEPGAKTGYFRVRRHIQGTPLVSIIIPSAGAVLKKSHPPLCLLQQCLDSIYQLSTYQNYEIVVVDGDDIPESVLKAIQGPKLSLVRCDRPFNFAERMNLGVKAAQGSVLLMLNDDTQVLTPDWIESMLELAQQSAIAAVGAKLLFPNGHIQHAGVLILDGNPTHAFWNGSGRHEGYYCSNLVNRNYLGVTGACLMIRRAVFEELNGFDEAFALNYNDVDLCLRAYQAGYRNVVTPYAQLIHYESVSRGRKADPEALAMLHARYAGMGYLQNDPYYNPNLSVANPHFQLAWPGR